MVAKPDSPLKKPQTGTQAKAKPPARAASQPRPRQQQKQRLETTPLAVALPGARPLRRLTTAELAARFEAALASADGPGGAHCIHESAMRGAMWLGIEAQLASLWAAAAPTIPDWLPTRHVEWLPKAYEVAARFRAPRGGRTNVYLVLLDYPERPERYGAYVGLSHYSPAERFDQHKAGIRASGSVLKRGLEVLTGPTLHLRNIRRAAAAEIEAGLAEALRAAGVFVKGGH